MIVKELIELLNKMPSEATVTIEGCHCIGNADGVILKNISEIMITRGDGVETMYIDEEGKVA